MKFVFYVIKDVGSSYSNLFNSRCEIIPQTPAWAYKYERI